MVDKLYTPEQANAALPLVRHIVTEVVDCHRRMADLVAIYQASMRAPSPPQEELNETRRRLAAATAQRDACVAELADLGVLLKDAQTGLADFPGVLDGERVLLCWRLGEPRVEWWHGEADGFAGRKPLPVLAACRT
jgi:hypothetical protein